MADDRARHVFVGRDQLPGAAGFSRQPPDESLGHAGADANGKDPVAGLFRRLDDGIGVMDFTIGDQQEVGAHLGIAAQRLA